MGVKLPHTFDNNQLVFILYNIVQSIINRLKEEIISNLIDTDLLVITLANLYDLKQVILYNQLQDIFLIGTIM